MLVGFPATIMGAGIGTPVALGFGSGSVNQSITTGADIPPSAVVLVMVFANGNSSAVSVGGNAATLASRATGDAGGYTTELWWYQAGSAISAGATISCTNANNGANRQVVAAAYVTGLSSATADKTATASPSPSTSPTASTGTLTQANEIVIGCFCGATQGTGAPTVTESSGFTSIYNKSGATAFGSGPDTGLTFAYRIVNATTSVAYNPTNSGGTLSGLYGELIVASFKG